jgi:ceramide glucosyltransferase
MLHLAIEIEVVLALLTLCGIAFSFIALWAAHRFSGDGRQQPPVAALAPVSVLKPLHGADSESYAALRSHCLQKYESYEIIFGVNDEDDQAVPLVRRLIAEFPDREVRLVISPQVFGSNRKVSNLVHMLREAKYQHILVNDGDIRVGPGYLRAVMSLFKAPTVGMVTCLYKGVPAKTIGSRLESLGIATDFVPGVLTARVLDGRLRFGLGSTLAMRLGALQQIGGFESVVDYLADDYQLGQRIAKAGFKVALAHEVVETAVPPYSIVEFWRHQLRWARTMRVSRPGGYAGLVLTFAFPWALLLAAMAPDSPWAWMLLALALLGRIAVALYVGLGILDDRQLLRNLWLLPLRDLLALAIWVCSYGGNTVTWKGTKFQLKQGRIHPVSSANATLSAKLDPEVHSEAQRR